MSADETPQQYCGGVMPVPESYGDSEFFTCSQCGQSCRRKSDFFEACTILKNSDLEPQEDPEPREEP